MDLSVQKVLENKILETWVNTNYRVLSITEAKQPRRLERTKGKGGGGGPL
jgi:hypothetical protein